MKEENKLKLLGAFLRIGYNVVKESTINSENKPYFDVLEACGKEIRNNLEEDPELKNVYKGSDVIKTSEELYNAVKKTFEE